MIWFRIMRATRPVRFYWGRFLDSDRADFVLSALVLATAIYVVFL